MAKLGQFLQEKNGQSSSTRLFALLITGAVIADYMVTVFSGTHSMVGETMVWAPGVWRPEWQTVGLVAASLGFKVLQKGKEN